jgi:CubicO group peptidase (beta-lactamase class C family)
VAGYIVERISGRPFDEYVAENILKPLNMTHSTFTQPLPSELAPFMSNGYRLGSAEAGPFEVINAFPAGSLSSSATDMAQFMMVHLADGQLGNARILKPETARLMHSRLFALDDAANAMCYGFYEESRNTQATRSTSTAICTWCWTRSSASSFHTTAPAAAAAPDD